MIIPSIDVSQGKAVQLRQGKDKILEKEGPEMLAKEFSRFGEIAVIDLDAALNRGNNKETIKRICQIAPCRVGGGIRSVRSAVEAVLNGAERVIVGTSVFNGQSIDLEFLEEIAFAIGKDRLIIALDSRHGKIVTHGWSHDTGMHILPLIKKVEPYTSEILVTCVEKEGMLQGTDIKTLRTIRKKTDLPITAAGGISTPKEIEELSGMEINCQLGMCIYTGKIPLEEAFLSSLDWKKGLIPTITQDTSGRVLMQAYSNRESLQRTFATNKVWYYSRSRKKLWMKGETSGHYQDFYRIQSDCDHDSLLVTVHQKGYACHKGIYSCFGSVSFSLQELYEVIQERLSVPSPGSYTASLTTENIKDKIREESQELIDSIKPSEIIWEAADLVYFILVYLVKNGVGLNEVLNELKKRRRIPQIKKLLEEMES